MKVPRRGRRDRVQCWIGVGVIALNMGGPVAPAQEALREPHPTAGEDAGKRLLESACTQCHGLAPITLTRQGRGGWADEVHKMVAWGAQIESETEARTLIEYLARTYGPSAGPMQTGPLPPGAVTQGREPRDGQSIELPAGTGAELVQAFCSGCHDLGRIVGTRRTAESWHEYTSAMLAKGDMSPPASTLKAINDYLTAHFGTLEKP